MVFQGSLWRKYAKFEKNMQNGFSYFVSKFAEKMARSVPTFLLVLYFV
jgi:hypothetical protein